MSSLLGDLIPAAIGVIASPLAIIAVVVVLLSGHPGPNGAAFLVGWYAAIVTVLTVGTAVASAFHDAPAETPSWVPWFQIATGGALLVAAVLTYRKGHHHARRMAAATTPIEVVDAAPQLPGWLTPVEHFDPWRSGLLGFGLCILNPVDLSFLLIAGVALAGSDAGPAATGSAAVLYVVVAGSSVAAPVVYHALRRREASEQLLRLKDWLARSSGTLNVVMLTLFGAMQLVKGLRGL